MYIYFQKLKKFESSLIGVTKVYIYLQTMNNMNSKYVIYNTNYVYC